MPSYQCGEIEDSKIEDSLARVPLVIFLLFWRWFDYCLAMNHLHKALLVILGIIIGVCIAVIPRGYMSKRERPEPTLAGQELPAKGIKINFDGLLDVYLRPCSGTNKPPRLVSRCKILGVVDEGRDSGRTSSWKGGYENHFGNWVCLQLEDGKRMFTPLSDIVYFIELGEK